MIRNTTINAAIARIRAESGGADMESDRAAYAAQLATNAADRAAEACIALHDTMAKFNMPDRIAATADSASASAAECARIARNAARMASRAANHAAKMSKVPNAQLPRAESEAIDAHNAARMWRNTAEEFADSARSHARSATRASARATARIQG